MVFMCGEYDFGVYYFVCLDNGKLVKIVDVFSWLFYSFLVLMKIIEYLIKDGKMIRGYFIGFNLECVRNCLMVILLYGGLFYCDI